MGLIDERYKKQNPPFETGRFVGQICNQTRKAFPAQKAGDKYFRIKFLYKILRNLFFFLS